MSRFITYNEILSNKVKEDFGVSVIDGTSMTIPGQGSDLAAIIASIVKLPPLDERTFDIPSGSSPDIQALRMKAALDSMYPSEGVNAAEDAAVRQKARKVAKEEAESIDNEEHSDEEK